MGSGTVTYGAALAAIFLEGWVFLLLSITGVRARLFTYVPGSIRLGMNAGQLLTSPACSCSCHGTAELLEGRAAITKLSVTHRMAHTTCPLPAARRMLCPCNRRHIPVDSASTCLHRCREQSVRQLMA